MKFLKNIINYILCIVCTLGVLGFFSSIILNTSVLLPSYYYNNFQKNNYYESLTEDINSKLSYLFLTYNIPQEISQGIIDSEFIKTNVDTTVKESIYYFVKKQDNAKTDIDLSKVESKLDDSIDKFLLSNKVIVNSDVKKELVAIKASFTNIIKNELEIFDLNYVQNSNVVNKFRSIWSFLYTKYYIFLLVSIISLLLNFVINKKAAIKLNLLILSIFSLALFMIAFSGYMSGFYKNIIISIDYIKAIVVTIIKDIFIRFSILGFLISVICAVLYKLTNPKKIRN